MRLEGSSGLFLGLVDSAFEPECLQLAPRFGYTKAASPDPVNQGYGVQPRWRSNPALWEF
jgi:hypothetical protein